MSEKTDLWLDINIYPERVRTLLSLGGGLGVGHVLASTFLQKVAWYDYPIAIICTTFLVICFSSIQAHYRIRIKEILREAQYRNR
jgi:hypothetical protein